MGLVYVVLVFTLCALGGGVVSAEKKARGRPRCLSFQETMDTCLAPLGGSLGLQPGDEHELLSDLNITKKLCQEGKLQDAMACLEEVFNGCAAASKAYGYRKQQPGSLNLMMANGNWKNSMERLCANIDYLREHETCTRVMAVESSHCIKRESKSFMDKATLVLAKALRRGRSGHKQLMDLGCHFAQNVNLCFQHSLNKETSCPCRYRHLIVEIVLDSMPPFCKPDLDYYYYAYGDCLDDDDGDFDEEGIDDEDGDFEDADGIPGHSGAEVSKQKADQVQANRRPGSALHKGGGGGGGSGADLPGEVVVVQKPELGGKEEEAAYKVHDLGQSQGHMGGAGSARSSSSGAVGVSAMLGWLVMLLLR